MKMLLEDQILQIPENTFLLVLSTVVVRLGVELLVVRCHVVCTIINMFDLYN